MDREKRRPFTHSYRKLHISTHSNREEDSIVSSQLRAEFSVALVHFFVGLGLESLLLAIHPLFQATYACILHWEELGWPIGMEWGERQVSLTEIMQGQ